MNYATELVDRGDYGVAIPVFGEVLDQDPKNSMANYQLGRMFYKLGILPTAERHLTRAIENDSSSPDAYLQLAS